MVRWCRVNFQCRGGLTSLDKGKARASFLIVGGGGVVWKFFSRLSFLSSISLFGRRPDID